MEKALIIILSVGFFVFAYILQVLKKDSLHPTSIILYFWGFFLLAPLIFLWQVGFSLYTLCYLYAALLSFSLSAFLLPIVRVKNNFKNIFINTMMVEKFCIFAPLASMIFSIFVIANSGLDIAKFLTEFSNVAGEFATMRGTIGVEYGVLGIFSVGLAYFSAWCGGLLYLYTGNVNKHIIFSLMSLFFIMLTQSSKLILFVGFSMFISGMIVAGLFIRTSQSIVHKHNTLGKFLILFILTAIAVAYSFTTREGYGESQDIWQLLKMLRFLLASYLLGPVYAFDDFFKSVIGQPSNSNYIDDHSSFGLYTFHSIFSMLGYSKEFPVGTYSETMDVSDIFETNIFTAFRGAIYDFGILGSILVFAVIGFAFNLSYYIAKKSQNSVAIGISAIAVPFGFIIYLISPFMANYLFLQAFLIMLFVKIIKIFRSTTPINQ